MRPEPSNSQPEQDGNPWDEVDALDIDSRRFVVRLLETADIEQALDASGRSTNRSAIRMLGDPKVRRAIERCAPLVGDSERAARILAPYVLERLARITLRGSDAQAVSAGRDMLAIGGEGPSVAAKGVDLGALVRGMRAARREASRADSGPKGIGSGAEKPALPAAYAVVAPDPVSGTPAKRGPGRPRKVPLPTPPPLGGTGDPEGAG